MTFRPVTPADEDLLARLFGRLSPESVYRRFFAMIHEIDPAGLRRLADNDGVSRVALAAEEDGEIVAVARYALVAEPDTAEVAIVVEDGHQGRHLGPELLRELAAGARRAGVTRFTATVLGENAHAMHVFRAVFPDLVATFESGTFELEIPLGPIPEDSGTPPTPRAGLPRDSPATAG